MDLPKLWNIFLYLLMSAAGKTLNDNESYIVDAIAGERAIIRTWPLKSSALSVIVKRDNIIRLNAFIDESIDEHTVCQNGQLILKYNHTIQEVSLMFDNISREHEGLYQIEVSFNRSKEASYEIETEGHERNYGRWNLEMNVLEPSEIKQGYVGQNIVMKFGNTSEHYTLLNYGQMVALLVGSVCNILTDSYLYGRLRCTSDLSGTMYQITVENVTQRDAGLYRVAPSRDERWRYFFNIKDNATRSVVGDNKTIGLFYNQQGKNRTLLVIHPNQEVMMVLPPTNIPKFKSNFKHRLLYSGDSSKSYMFFTMLNVRTSDAGLYTIQIVHGNTIIGSKELIVEAETITDRTDEPFVPKSACYVESLVWGAVCVTLLMITCLISMQRRNIWNLEAAQRLLPEKRETVSFATPAGTMVPLPMPPLTEVRTDQTATQSGSVYNAVLGLHYAASKDLATVDSDCITTCSRVHAEYDKLAIDNCVDCNKSSDKFNGTAGAPCHYDVEEGILGVVSPSVSTFVTTLVTDEYKYNEKAQRQVAQSCLAAYAKVKKRQIDSSRNIAILNQRNEFAYEPEEDDGYKSVDTPKNQICLEYVKVSEDEHVFVLRDKKQTEQKIIPGPDANCYTDVDL